MLTGAEAGGGLLPLLAFAAVVTVTPGGANLLAAASGASFGPRRSLPLLTGISAGLAALTGLAGAGFGALLHTAPAFEVALRAAGSVYLLWLAWRIAGSGPPALREASAAPAGFLAGIVLLWLNPKAWTMAFAASAAHAEVAPGPAALAAVLGLVFGAAAAISLLLWCAFGLPRPRGAEAGAVARGQRPPRRRAAGLDPADLVVRCRPGALNPDRCRVPPGARPSHGGAGRRRSGGSAPA